MIAMIGRWIRPWPGETVCGYIFALSGDRLLCRAAGGVEFSVPLSALNQGAEIYDSPKRLTGRPKAINSWGPRVRTLS